MTAATPGADPLEAGDAGGKVIRGGGMRVAAHVTGVLAGVISAPLVVRHLGVDDYGRFVVVGSILQVVLALTEGGLNAVAIRRYATADAASRRAIVSNLLGLRFVLSLVAAAGAMGFGLIAGYDDVVLAGLALGSVALLLNTLWGTLTVPLQTGLRMGSMALVEVVRSAGSALGLVVLVVLGSGLLGFYVVAPVVAAVALVMVAVLVRREVPLRPRFDRAQWSSLLRETALYAAASALGAMYFQVALVATSVLSDDRETGVFSIAFRIVEIGNALPWLLASTVFPVLAHAAANDRERLRYAVTRAVEGGLAAGVLIAVIIALGAPVAIDVIAGSEEGADDAEDVLRLLAIGVSATFVAAPLSFLLLSLERYRWLLVANAGIVLLALVLSAALIPPLGATGAGITTAVLELALAGTYLALAARALEGPPPGLAAVRPVLLAVAAAAVVGVPLLAVSAVLATIAGAAAYALVLWRAGGVPVEVAQALRRRGGG